MSEENVKASASADQVSEVNVIFAGVAFLISEEKKGEALKPPPPSSPEIPTYSDAPIAAGPAPETWFEGEVALLAVSPDHATPEEIENAGVHNPVLVVRRSHIASVDGPLGELPLESTVKGEWFQKTPLSELAAWPLEQSIVWPLGVDGKVITFIPPAEGEEDFQSLDYVPSLNVFQPGLTLSRAWRSSPHVTTRFLLSAGEVGSDRPLQRNMERLKFTYGHQPDSAKRRYSDVIRYKPKASPTGLVIEHGGARTIIQFNESIDNIWVLNLDDPRRSDPTYDHFILFGLLPWNFTIPRTFDDVPLTGGDCASGRYHEPLKR
jgi:hypothetical protein